MQLFFDSGTTIMEVEVVGEEAEEVEVTTNKRGVAAVATEEVGVVKTAHNIVELRTSERKKNVP